MTDPTPVVTPTSAFSWRPDVVSVIDASDVIPDSVPPMAATLAGIVTGDAVALRVPYIATDVTAGFVPEGNEIGPSIPALDEVVVMTSKIAALARVSNESMVAMTSTTGTASLYASFARSLTRDANTAFLTNPVTSGQPTGLLNVTGIVDGGTLGTSNADTLVDAVATVQSNNGQATTVIASPTAWAAVRNLKSTTNGGVPLIGDLITAGTLGMQLLGCQVIVCNQMTANELLILDRTDVMLAWSGITLAASADPFFTADSMAIRATLRLGWAVVHPNRIVKISTVGSDSAVAPETKRAARAAA